MFINLYMLPLLISLCCHEILCYWIWRLPDFLLKLEKSWQGLTLKSLELLICTYLHRFACVLHVDTSMLDLDFPKSDAYF